MEKHDTEHLILIFAQYLRVVGSILRTQLLILVIIALILFFK